ncbi:MAG: hypothetical protein HZB13_13045 [Acidobacteria bacterium]|nr:hypothetical protein [Acidobacteriota bacterium]
MVISELAVAGFTENPAVAPAGKPAADKVTRPAKPPCLVTVIVLLTLPPCAAEPETGDALSVKF